MSMRKEPTPLVTEFPRVMRGYAPEAVDEFVLRTGGRLAALQTDLAKRNEELTKLRGDLTAAQSEAISYRDKEKLMTNALIGAERVRQSAEEEARAALERAQADAEAVLDEARREAEAILTEAETCRGTALEEARREAEPLLAQAHAEVEALLADARSQHASIVEAARSEAVRVIDERRSEGDELATKLSALRAEYNETLARIRSALADLSGALPPETDSEGAALPGSDPPHRKLRVLS